MSESSQSEIFFAGRARGGRGREGEIKKGEREGEAAFMERPEKQGFPCIFYHRLERESRQSVEATMRD